MKRVDLYEPLLNLLASHADLKLGLDRSKEKYVVIDCINKVFDLILFYSRRRRFLVLIGFIRLKKGRKLVWKNSKV